MERVNSPIHHLVVVGGGFGGVQAVKHLEHAPIRITLIDRRNFTLFQPLTYQIATGSLSPGDIAYPLRALFRDQANVDIVTGEVTGIELDARRVTLSYADNIDGPPAIEYDTLIVAAGSSYSYFGHEEFREYAHEVKTLESAVAVRSQILRAFERAEEQEDPALRVADMTFVVVGAGPTGVEMAGQIGELAHHTLLGCFRRIDPRTARVLLLDGADRVLTSFPPSLSKRAASALDQLGVTVTLQRMVVDVSGDGVVTEAPDGSRDEIPSRTVVWAAGVTASGLARELASAHGGEVDPSGRLTVEPDLTLAGHPEVFAIGDMVRVRGSDGEVRTLPGVAPVAIQMGRHVARAVKQRIAGEPNHPFRYVDKGNLATIGRGKAVADLHIARLSGFPAWVVWLVVHLWYLIGFRNRFVVTAQWAFSYFTGGRGSCLIEDARYVSGPPADGGGAGGAGA